ncbi:hypothetical protein DOTSEDRAFT_91755 [Dothistroma septosporum NZE10]|uniref:Aminoglycoside phosphotransferase domain-containing protein n=1 Tax=Dothistroma septosporum (strain NZE10 / CBS 128990) TaxID=675120 RepID=M2YKJ2_DOTSN|nr:hypothetical protein DOTSEDRAFT_91755 [Dothistroma septosporum NZE10]
MRYDARYYACQWSPKDSIRDPDTPSWAFSAHLHEYTSGRFLFNEQQRLQERRQAFNVHELANVICGAISRPVEDLSSLEKFAEGGFNRILQATFNDGREILARLPFIPRLLYDILWQQGLPVPKVLEYSADSHNSVGIEYLLLEKLPGRPLGDRWFSLENKVVVKVVKQIVDLEQQYVSLRLPASGSLYHAKDLGEHETSVPLPGSTEDTDIVVGPIASYAWEYRERARLGVDRGPWQDFSSCFEAGGRRELAFCKEYGQPRLNVDRYLRELDNLELQYPSYHAVLLNDFLRMVLILAIPSGSSFARPTLRHPDLSPNNILVNDDNDIVGIIDWQHTIVLPLALCAGIPHFYQNWGDPISESLQKPETKLSADFDSLSPAEQKEQLDTIRRRLIHFYYAALSLKKMEDHFDAFRNQNAMLRAKLFSRAGGPWEGSSLSLEHAIIEAQQQWPMDLEGSSSGTVEPCPFRYSPERINACVKKVQEEEEKLEELEDMRGMLGTDSQGWVQDDDHLARAKTMRDLMKSRWLKECDTDLERKSIQDHFPFDDHEE